MKRLIWLAVLVLLLLSAGTVAVADNVVSTPAVEYKNITGITLYQKTDDGVQELTSVSEDALSDLSVFLAKITMEKLPAFYATIGSYQIKDGVIQFNLDLDNVVYYNEDGSRSTGLCVNFCKTDSADIETVSPAVVTDYTIHTGYDSSKAQIYNNLYEIMPFMDSSLIVEKGNTVAGESALASKTIRHVIPVDISGNVVTGLGTSNKSNISKILLVFTDDTIITYSVSYVSVINGIAVYSIPELDLFYNYDGYAAMDDTIVANLVSRIEALDYDTSLEGITSESDSRLYKEHLDVTKLRAQEIALGMMGHEYFGINLDNEILRLLAVDFISDELLARYMYGMNYMDYWYSFNVNDADGDTLSVRDLLIFYGGVSGTKKSAYSVTGFPIAANAKRATNNAHGFYEASLKSMTGQSTIYSYIEYLVAHMTSYASADDWFTDYFGSKNILYEKAVAGHTDVDYRAWTMLKKNYSTILPALTLPEKTAYLIASPTQMQFGALSTYSKDPETDYETIRTKVNTFGDLVNTFYTTAAGFVDASYLNALGKLGVDTRYTYEDGTWKWVSAGTSSPFHSFFTEALGLWAGANGSAAYSNGYTIFWVCHSTLNSFSTWSHETGHMEDNSVFLWNNHRRAYGWAEDYADGNTTQGFGDGGVNFNLAYTYDRNASVITNLTPERINSLDKINDYYKNMFNASDMLDYLEALAFLQLTPEEQAVVAVQISYYTIGTSQLGTTWTKLTAADFEAMDLQTVEDLWDNRITIKPGVSSSSSAGVNCYGAESIYTRRWYFPYNDTGRPDSNSFKYTAWQMLGTEGYEKGYIGYYSNGKGKTLNDLNALTMNTAYSSWKEYRLSRYTEMEDNRDNLTGLDTDIIVQQYLEALRKDAEANNKSVTNATNVKRMNYYYLKRTTNDFLKGVFDGSSVTHIATAQEFATKLAEDPYGDYVLDNDIDLSTLYQGSDTTPAAIVTGTFRGRLDGGGHTISGTDLPLFESMACAYAQNLVFKDTHRTTVSDSISLSYVNVTIDTVVLPVSTAAEFAAMSDSPTYRYILMNDIDFSGYTATNGRVVSGIFTGQLNGNGYTVKNLSNASLFTEFNGTAFDFTLDNFVWSAATGSGDYVTAFAQSTSGAYVHDLEIRNVTLQGRHRVALLCSNAYNSATFENIYIHDCSVTGGNVSSVGFYNSLAVGRSYGSVMRNMYVQGTLTVFGTDNGGLTGSSESSGTVIQNALVNVDLVYQQATSDSRYASGCVVGNCYNNNLSVKNVVSIGKVSGNVYSFTGASGYTGCFSNCYELTSGGGILSANGSNIMPVTPEGLTRSFYLDTLGFDSSWMKTDTPYVLSSIEPSDSCWDITLLENEHCIQSAVMIVASYTKNGSMIDRSVVYIPYSFVEDVDPMELKVALDTENAQYIEAMIISDWVYMLPSGASLSVAINN